MARPTGVTILAVLSFLGAGLCLLAAAGMFLMGSSAGIAAMAGRGGNMGGTLAAMGAFAGIACLILAAIGIVFGVMGIVKSLAPLMAAMLVWHVILIAIDAWIVRYMFKPQVKAAFGERAAS